MEVFQCPLLVAAGFLTSALAVRRGGYALHGWFGAVFRHGSGHQGSRWRSCGVCDEAFEVLDGGGEKELVSGTGEATQSQADH